MSEQREVAVKVWDLPVRLVHWALVLLFAFQVLSASLGEKLIDWHMRSGYAILTLVLFRVLWGVAGSRSARFWHTCPTMALPPQHSTTNPRKLYRHCHGHDHPTQPPEDTRTRASGRRR